ncbi:MOSC domain-containing protein [Nitratireductor sp. XY-223]|uniref:MOSC domain-containing protein n=1 Tax=Nitratireductor sp. XY-223 TaxID=2561926 RepID=UPI0010A9A7C7|nr:MOSC domain-containing protein [Nitratireductor sp. XY-223]
MEIIGQKRAIGKVGGVYSATKGSFTTEPVDSLELTFEGIAGDHHAGLTRRAGGREPWYPRGTEIRNERQLTLLSPEDLAGVASDMGIAEIKPEWIGGNITIEGIPNLSMLPASTLLFFEGGVTLKVDFLNLPCRVSGTAIAEHYPDRDPTALSLDFVKAARRRRGLIAWVELPGTIRAGEAVRAQIPEQWIYTAGTGA